MNPHLLLQLIALRYKLLWAQTRTRNGRIATFLALYLFGVLLLILLAAGGFGAAALAIRSGHAETVAQAVLGGLFLNAIIASVLTGFGINSAFTDLALRRFPLTAPERLAARHLTGITEPLWILVLGLDVGLATGMYVFGAANFGLGMLAIILLLIADYLCARVLASLIEWVSQLRGGTAILGLLLFTLCILPGLLAPRLANAHGFMNAFLAALRFTPPFAAAALLVAPDGRLLASLSLLFVWIAGLLVALAYIERRSAAPRTAVAAAITWNNGYERAAAIFGPAMAPMIARSLRYYLRSSRVRFNYLIALPVLAIVSFNNAAPGDPRHKFVTSLGAFVLAGFMGTAVMAVNQFGYDASGFRRYFLLPAPPGHVLRASSYTSLLVGGSLVALAFLVWMLFAPIPRDWRMAPMLASAGVGGLFLLNALAVWTSLLAPRRVAFDTTFGNQLSLTANVLIIGGVILSLGGSALLDHLAGPDRVLTYWWTAIPAACLAIAIYFASLSQGEIVFVKRKERLLNLLEGRD